jgi:hypothetical protein
MVSKLKFRRVLAALRPSMYLTERVKPTILIVLKLNFSFLVIGCSRKRKKFHVHSENAEHECGRQAQGHVRTQSY